MKLEYDGRIAALTSSASKVVEEFSEGGNFTVWFLGGETKLRLSLINNLPTVVNHGEIGVRLDEAADRIEDELSNIDEQVLSQDEDRLAWSASLIADRSPYAGDLQLNAARYLVIQETLSDGGRHLFFVDDLQTAQAFSHSAGLNGFSLKNDNLPKTKSILIQALRARVSALTQHFGKRKILDKLRRRKPIRWNDLGACDVLILDWAGEETFDAKAPNKNASHLARMPEILRNAGCKVGFLANPLSWTQCFSKIAYNACSAFDPVLMVSEAQSYSSIIRGAWVSWRMKKRLSNKVRLGGVDLSPIFEMEKEKDLQRTQTTMAFTYSEIGRFLAEHGVQPKVILYPYEHQGWERSFIIGIRKYLPMARIVAYQHAPFASRYIGFFPSRSEIEAKMLPDQLILMGKLYPKLFAQKGFPIERLSVGGSLRYENASNNIKEKDTKTGWVKDKTILVGTSIDYDETLDLTIKSALVALDLPDTKLIVNFHPVVDKNFKTGIQEKVSQFLGTEAVNIEFSNNKIQDLLPGVDVLLYNNSGTVFDALSIGVPSVYVPLEGAVSYDKVPNHLSRRVTTVSELKAEMQNIFSSKEVFQPDISVGGSIGAVDEKEIVRVVTGK